MDVIIQSLGFKASEALEQLISQKMKDLKSDQIIRANVTLYQGSATNPENNYCEVRLEVPGNDLFVKKNNQYFETAVTDCTEVLAGMLNKTKDIAAARRQADAASIQDNLLSTQSEMEGDTELEDVVK